jgi:hypothetical protein
MQNNNALQIINPVKLALAIKLSSLIPANAKNTSTVPCKQHMGFGK